MELTSKSYLSLCWTTNESYIVNPKVIIPLKAYRDIWKRMDVSQFEIVEKISDIEKCFNYLNGCIGADINVSRILEQAQQKGITKNIQTKYMELTFYKKGTCHIRFKDLDVLKRLNIFAGRKHNWLPYTYGKKSYQEMNEQEKVVIDSFEGQSSYEETFKNAASYVLDFMPDVSQMFIPEECNGGAA